MIEHKLSVGPFQCNCRILVCPKTGKGIVVDPGDESAKILQAVAGLKLPTGLPIEIEYLLHTHGHLDHIGGTRGVKQGLQKVSHNHRAVIALHSGDDPLYQQLQTQGQFFGMQFETPIPVEKFLEHEEELRVGEMKFSIIHTPGHSPGSIGIRLHEDSAIGAPELVMTGDTLFQGSVGRTDLWGADGPLMMKNIRERFFTLDGDTRVCPGHGPDSRMGVEKCSNPFFR